MQSFLRRFSRNALGMGQICLALYLAYFIVVVFVSFIPVIQPSDVAVRGLYLGAAYIVAELVLMMSAVYFILAFFTEQRPKAGRSLFDVMNAVFGLAAFGSHYVGLAFVLEILPSHSHHTGSALVDISTAFFILWGVGYVTYKLSERLLSPK